MRAQRWFLLSALAILAVGEIWSIGHWWGRIHDDRVVSLAFLVAIVLGSYLAFIQQLRMVRHITDAKLARELISIGAGLTLFVYIAVSAALDLLRGMPR
jgi:magnesium-transporting ATPase (P-type)